MGILIFGIEYGGRLGIHQYGAVRLDLIGTSRPGICKSLFGKYKREKHGKKQNKI